MNRPEYYFLFKECCWLNKWNMMAHVNSFRCRFWLISLFLNDLTQVHYIGSNKTQWWVCFFELLIEGRGEELKLLSTDFSVYPPISYQGREMQIPSHPHQKIIKHVLFLFSSWSKFCLLTVLCLELKLSSLSKMSVLINWEQKDQN